MEQLPDSGMREEYPTGAFRDNPEGKGAYYLISPIALRRLALRMEQGALKYSARNWEKGMYLSRYVDAIIRHTEQLIMGDDNEDHAAAVMFNAMAFMHTEEMMPEMDDLPRYSQLRLQWITEREYERILTLVVRLNADKVEQNFVNANVIVNPEADKVTGIKNARERVVATIIERLEINGRLRDSVSLQDANGEGGRLLETNIGGKQAGHMLGGPKPG